MTAWEEWVFGGFSAFLRECLKRSGHVQIFVVAIYAKLQRIFEIIRGYAVKHNLEVVQMYDFLIWEERCCFSAVLLSRVGIINNSLSQNLRQKQAFTLHRTYRLTQKLY